MSDTVTPEKSIEKAHERHSEGQEGVDMTTNEHAHTVQHGTISQLLIYRSTYVVLFALIIVGTFFFGRTCVK